MGKENTAPELNFPHWKWQSELPWSILGTILGAVFALLAPEITDISLPKRLILLPISIFSSILILALLRWIYLSGRIAILRVWSYPKLYKHSKRLTNQLIFAKESLTHLSNLSDNRNSFEILKVRYYKEMLYIFIEKKKEPKLEINDRLFVIDREDWTSMGVFKVTEKRSRGYNAVAEEGVDGLWAGYVIQQNQPEIDSPPNTVAIFAPRRKPE